MSHNDNFGPPGTPGIPGMPQDDHGYGQSSIETDAAILTQQIDGMPDSSPIIDIPQPQKSGLFIKIVIGVSALVLAAGAAMMFMEPEKPAMKPVTAAPAPVEAEAAPMAIPGMQAAPAVVEATPKQESAPFASPPAPTPVDATLPPVPQSVPVVTMPAEPVANAPMPGSTLPSEKPPTIETAPIQAAVVEAEKPVAPEVDKKEVVDTAKNNCNPDVKAEKPKTKKPVVKKANVSGPANTNKSNATDGQWKKIF